jgi:two-component system, sensor histidine kinase LadS
LTNALKYSPPDTLIEMSVQSVLDAKGISHLTFVFPTKWARRARPAPDRAFERFYRAEAARNQSGAGLGLWLSQELAHALGTEVVMQQDDHKISFSLVLPYA